MRSSSAIIFPGVGILPPSSPFSIDIPFDIDAALATKIKNHKNQEIAALNTLSHRCSTKNLLDAYNEACRIKAKTKNSEEKLRVEQFKLAIMQSLLQELQTKYNHPTPPDEPESSWLQKLPLGPRWVVFGALTLCGLIMDAMGSFLFSKSLFELIPNISSPLVFAGSAFFTVVSASLFYSFEAKMLKKTLAVPDLTQDTTALLATYTAQIKTKRKIGHILYDARKNVDSAHLAAYGQLDVAFNHSIADIKNKIEGYKESRWGKVLKWGITFFGAFMAIADGYYIASALFPMLLGTPAGWAITVIAIAVSLSLYTVMRASGIFSSHSSLLQETKNLKKALKKQDADGITNQAKLDLIVEGRSSAERDYAQRASCISSTSSRMPEQEENSVSSPVPEEGSVAAPLRRMSRTGSF